MDDLKGKVFGQWTVIGDKKKIGHNQRWYCRCVCGKERYVIESMLKDGTSKSCGCQRHNRMIHGLSSTKLYAIWRTMRDRCNLPTNKEYERYGARGISVCSDWNDNFLSFYFWAINEGYDETAERGKFTLERIDNNGNYEPSNCRWANGKEQARNRRNTVWLTHEGITKSFSEWCEIYDIPYYRARNRYKVGKSFDEIFAR